MHGLGWTQHAARCSGRRLPDPAGERDARERTERVKRAPAPGDRLVEVRVMAVEVVEVSGDRVRWREERGGTVTEHEGDLAEWYRRHAYTPGRPGWWVTA